MPTTLLPQGIRSFRHAHPVLLLAAVATIAIAVMTSATVVRFDAALGGLARTAASAIPNDAGFAVSTLGGTALVMPLMAASALLLCVFRHWRGALTVVLSVLGTQALVALVKGVVERPRPQSNSALADASGFSFPSAHSATAMALYATLTLIAAGACHGRARVVVALAGFSLVVAVGLSRIQLAAHYPTDVLAGWLTGAAVVGASWLLVRRLAAPRAAQARS
jgi:undecaprenyl-diphosphatase